MTRLQQLQERIEEPLLVTAPVNVRYLTGFDSTNAALLVERAALGSSATSAMRRPASASRTSSSA